ncbi:competence protein CoiA family protein [Rhizobium leguminosarum]|uniref:competence protein CoiA family protein n=1 Tax=Rhizobium leguminosarum TaxID=384 RepID=UPI001C98DFD7|nr:hypothetical protein [Rhizobium leguminosarum]MBY5466337.1 hypothetical protein [Rhizobium leguminosarum]
MLYAWVNGTKRAPIAKGETTACPDCGGTLTSVMPVENVPHWRHKAGDCDPWSEPEGPWHLGWKEKFDVSCREIGLRDAATGDRHRADILCGAGTIRATILELQHSSISEEERIQRETFYRQSHRMFWLVHIHNENAFHGYSFGFSLDFSNSHTVDGHQFAIMRWSGRSKQFIEKWKRAEAHVFFDYQGHIFYLAGEGVSRRIGGPFKKGMFALCHLKTDDFLRAVHWSDTIHP